MSFAKSDTPCPHAWDESCMRAPPSSSLVHKDECAYCCRACYHAPGVLVCMSCFTGVCAEHVAKHMQLNASHAMYVRVQEKLPAEPAPAVTDTNKLGVVAAKEYEYAACCGECRVEFAAVPELAAASFAAIVHAPVPGAVEMTNEDPLLFARAECPHLVCLEQQPSPFPAAAPPTSEHPCNVPDCGCCLNNWMCVTCGAIGCPRTESGGKGHALAHFHETGHPASVKLGTTVADGADFYCYLCDDTVADVHYAAHMRHFGIDVATAKKTAKTLGEMEYDYSSQFDFNKITEAGADLEPATGPGHTGIYNIGNSCYIASVVQCLMRFPVFQKRYYPGGVCAHQAACRASPYNCRQCQTERLAAGLLSGAFSRSDVDAKLNGVSPRLFKNVFANNHPDFSTGGQQDAQEYFAYLLQEMQRHMRDGAGGAAAAVLPADAFEMVVEQRIQCRECRKVRYSYTKECCLSLAVPMTAAMITAAAAATPTVPTAAGDAAAAAESAAVPERPRFSMQECLTHTFAPTTIDCRCEGCSQPSEYESTARLRTFPDLLAVYVRRTYFDVATVSTKKLDVYVEAPQVLDLGAFRGHGKQEDEAPMPESPQRPPQGGSGFSGGANTAGEVDELALATVVSMGIEPAVARLALLRTDMNVERAVDYIFSHPDLQDEASGNAGGAGGANGGDGASAAADAAKTAATDGQPAYELVGMVSHMGASARSGHYVCHIKDPAGGGGEPARWVLFNDEKVGVSKEPPFSMASLYFYQRRQ